MPSLQSRTANSTFKQAITISAFTCEKVSGALVLSMSVKILLVSSVSHRAANYSLHINHTCFSAARFSFFLSASLSRSYEILQPMAFIKCYFLLCQELKETIMIRRFLMAALKKQKGRSCLLAFPDWYLWSLGFLNSPSHECWNYDLLLHIGSIWTPNTLVTKTNFILNVTKFACGITSTMLNFHSNISMHSSNL